MASYHVLSYHEGVQLKGGPKVSYQPSVLTKGMSFQEGSFLGVSYQDEGWPYQGNVLTRVFLPRGILPRVFLYQGMSYQKGSYQVVYN